MPAPGPTDLNLVADLSDGAPPGPRIHRTAPRPGACRSWRDAMEIPGG
ncbi:hypothetical protein LC55x_1342 [Lysobacter capsici]|nr:hypothetical protein LC55x_1342 [Lysobacter capsici]